MRRPGRGRTGLWGALLGCVLVTAAFLAPRWEPVRVWLLSRTPLDQLQAQAAQPGADAWTHYFVGATLAQQGRHAEAVPSFSSGLRALELRDDEPLRARLGGDLALSLALLGDGNAAMPYLKRALEIDAGNLAAQMALGHVLMQRKQYEVAAQQFHIVNILEPRHAEGWFGLGRAHNAARKPEAAQPALRKAIELNPREPRYLLEMGDSLGYSGNLAEAETYFAKAVAVAPDNRDAAAALARARVLRARTPEEYREARKALAPFAEEAGGNPFFLGQMGILDAQFGELADAEKHLKRAVALKPDHPEAWYNLSMTYTRQGRNSEAAAAMRRFRQIEGLYRRVNALQKRLVSRPNDLPMNLELVRALEAQGKHPEALAQFQHLQRLHPNHPAVRAEYERLARKHRSPKPHPAPSTP